ncbi:MAG: ADP-ribosylglycohydrolase family protein [Halolamina sp.]
MTNHDRAAGVLLGLACGDALGRPVASRAGHSIAREYGRLTEMRGGGTRGQSAGTVTGATALTRRLAESLVARERFDRADVADRFRDWYATDPETVSATTAAVLERVAAGADPETAGQAVRDERPASRDADSGSLARCGALAVAFEDADDLAAVAAAASRLTHADTRCVESCVALTRVLRELLDGAAPEAALDAALSLAGTRGAPRELRTVLAVAADTGAAELSTDGDVVRTLETALHDGLTAESAEEAVVTAVNRGGETDVVGAVAGAVAGARFGASALPERWLDHLDGRDRFADLARSLADGGFEPSDAADVDGAESDEDGPAGR